MSDGNWIILFPGLRAPAVNRHGAIMILDWRAASSILTCHRYNAYLFDIGWGCLNRMFDQSLLRDTAKVDHSDDLIG